MNTTAVIPNFFCHQPKCGCWQKYNTIHNILNLRVPESHISYLILINIKMYFSPIYTYTHTHEMNTYLFIFPIELHRLVYRYE